MKRIAAVVVALAVVLVALWFWRDRSHRASRPGGGAASAGAGSADGVRGRPAVEDPRQLARASIRGVVRAKGGGPLVGAQVCTTWSGAGVVDEDSRDPRCAISDATGAYALMDLVPAAHTLTASAAAHQPRAWRDPVTGQDDSVRLKPGEARAGVDFALPTGGVEVTGVVEDVSGGPVAGALVTVSTRGMWSRGGAAGATRTDEQGRFALWSKPGTANIYAAAEGYAMGQAETHAPSALVRIYLTPESSLSGTVVAEGDRRPIAGATVRVSGGLGEGSWGSARSDADGRFRFSRLSPGRYKPSASGDGLYGEPAESVLLGLGQSVDGVVITVGAASAVRGQIVIERGGQTAPCPRGSVSLFDKASGLRVSDGVEDDGVVEMRAVLPGHYEVEVRCRDHAAADRYPPIDVVAGRDVAGLVWGVGAGATIVGVVRNAAGQPVADASVSARSTGGAARGQTGSAFANSADDGKFRLGGLVAGNYLMRVMRDGERAPTPPPTATVTAGGETTIEIVLPASGAIAGTVVDTDGKPVAGADVTARGATWAWTEGAVSGDDGSFLLAGVEPGVQRVTASNGWFDELRKPGTTDDDRQGEAVRVVAGQTATTRLVVEAQRGTIAGIVKDGKDEPVVDAWILATRESDAAGAAAGGAMRSSRWSWGQGDRPVVTGLEGRFTVGKLSPGVYTVRAYRRGGGEAVAEHVALGATVTLTIPATGSLSGVAVLAGGGAPDKLEVSLSNSQTGFSRSESFFRTGGKFVMRDLPAGELTVSADAAGGRAETKLVLGPGEDKTGVALTLAPKLVVKGRFVDLDTQAPVPGIRASVAPAFGNGGTLTFISSSSGDRAEISGDDGRFVVANAPGGLVYLSGVPRDLMDAPYGISRWVVELAAGPEVDVGDIPLPKRRVRRGDPYGELGISFVEPVPDADPRVRVMTVSRVEPGGPAAKAGIVAGDVVVSVDGHDVKGARATLASPLMGVGPGTTVALGLQRGVTISVTAEAAQ